MSVDSERIAAWKQKQRDAGFQPITIWISALTRDSLDRLATHRQLASLGEVVDELTRHARWDIKRSAGPRHSQFKVITDREEAIARRRPVLERIYALHDRKYSSRLIAKMLTNEGIPTFRGRARWHGESVRYLLRHRDDPPTTKRPFYAVPTPDAGCPQGHALGRV